MSINVDSLLNATADCLRFVTRFFEIISQSGPHIYHSALQLTPQSSFVWKLYNQQIHSVARVAIGAPASWDSCIARVETTQKIHCAVWSPCGQFIAVGVGITIEIRDSTTLERVSVLKPPSNPCCSTYYFAYDLLTFSPDGCLLACYCEW